MAPRVRPPQASRLSLITIIEKLFLRLNSSMLLYLPSTLIACMFTDLRSKHKSKKIVVSDTAWYGMATVHYRSSIGSCSWIQCEHSLIFLYSRHIIKTSSASSRYHYLLY